MRPEYHIIRKPYQNGVYCGDAGLVKQDGDTLFLAVIDGLGHGKKAQDAAQSCICFLEAHHRNGLTWLAEAVHRHIRGSRGAVAALCRIDTKKKNFSCVSVGDITVRRLNNERFRICSRPGILGYQARSFKQETRQLAVGDILLMHTDGISSHFTPKDLDGLLEGDARCIAENIMARYEKLHDDSLCIVVRCLK